MIPPKLPLNQLKIKWLLIILTFLISLIPDNGPITEKRDLQIEESRPLVEQNKVCVDLNPPNINSIIMKEFYNIFLRKTIKI